MNPFRASRSLPYLLLVLTNALGLAWLGATHVIPSPASAAPRTAPELGRSPVLVLGGLDAPRGIALGPNGEVYVADSGSAGQPGSGRLVRVTPDGASSTLLAGATNATADPHGQTYNFGLSDVALSGDRLLFTVGVGSSVPGQVGPNRLLRLEPGGRPADLFDLERFEQEHDPDGRGAGSNATGIAVAPDGTTWVGDAGGNWVARLGADGTVLSLVALPADGDAEAVPTGMAIGPDGDLYVALFRCRVPATGQGAVARVRSDGSFSLVATALTGPIDVAFGPEGALYILEFASDYAPDTGRLLRVGSGATTDVLLDGLNYPTSFAVDGAGRVYVTQMSAVAGGSPGTGRLVRFDPASP